MDEAASVTVEEFLEALSRSGVPLPHEIGAFIALSVCEAVSESPVRVSPQSVSVDGAGQVVVAAAEPATEAQASAGVVALLGSLLVRAAPGVPPGLLSLVEAGPRPAHAKLAPLRDALEGALVPLNRTATARVLARIVRESSRGRASVDEGGDPAGTAARLDALLGVDPAEAEKYRPSPLERQLTGQVTGQVTGRPAGQVAGHATTGEPSTRDVPAARDADGDEAPLGRGSPELTLSDPFARDVAKLAEAPAHQQHRWLWLAALAALVVAIAAYFLGSTAPAEPSTPQPTGELGAVKPGSTPTTAAPGATVAITTRPTGVQVLMDIGRTGEAIGGFAIGRAHELVVLDGEADLLGRLTVGPDTDWGRERLVRLELSSGVAPASPAPDALAPAPNDLGPTRLGQDLGTATGEFGRIQVDGPAGATVYQLVAISAPEARIAGLPSGLETTLRFYRRGYLPKTVVLSPAQAADAAQTGEPLAVELTLSPST